MESANQVFNSVDTGAESSGSPQTTNNPSTILGLKKKNKSAIGIRPSMGGGQ
jgi:hypothetical protein